MKKYLSMSIQSMQTKLKCVGVILPAFARCSSIHEIRLYPLFHPAFYALAIIALVL